MKLSFGVLLLALLILSFAGLFFFKMSLTGSVIEEYSYTAAICNETNYCEDYFIECNGSEVVSMSAITGAAVQHSLSWEDPRENASELCN